MDPDYFHHLDATNGYSVSRRIRIDGRLRGVGDTVYIPFRGRNGTIIHIGIDVVLVIVHEWKISPTVEKFEWPFDLKQGEGISPCIRSYLNVLRINFYDEVVIENSKVDERNKKEYRENFWNDGERNGRDS